MMIGQQFSPFSHQDPTGQQSNDPGSNVQQAIQILRIRYPQVFGGYMPSGVMGPGAAMAPPRPSMPMPLPMPGGPGPMGGPSMPGPGPLPTPTFGGPAAPPQAPGRPPAPAPDPVIHYQPLPGGTAGPNPRPGFPRPRPNPQPRRLPR
jgi:hypothetical protein